MNSPKMKTWGVTIPFAEHLYKVVEAATEDEAIDAAMANATSDDIESWDSLYRFQQGNVSYCPQPWEAEAVDETIEDDEQ